MVNATIEEKVVGESPVRTGAAAADLLGPTDDCFTTLYQRCKAAVRERSEAVQPLFGFLGCTRGEGVSTVAASVAVAAAASGERRVLLVDANFARPQQADVFGIPRSPGFAEHLLAKGGPATSVGTPIARLPNLVVLPAGEALESGAALYESPRLATFLKLLPLHFSFVVFDLPSLKAAKGGLRLAAMLTGVVLVVEAERIRWEAAARVKDLLLQANVPLLGGVLNKRRRHLPGWLYDAL